MHNGKGNETFKIRKNSTLEGRTVKTDNKTFKWAGVEMSATPEVIMVHGSVYMVKVKGRNSWSGIGESTYYPPEYHVGRIIEGKWSGNNIEIEYSRPYAKAARALADGYFHAFCVDEKLGG